MSRPKTVDRNAPFQSPRNAAIITGLSVGFIRDGCKAGEIPHIMVGSDIRVNVPALLEQLDRQSRGMIS